MAFSVISVFSLQPYRQPARVTDTSPSLQAVNTLPPYHAVLIIFSCSCANLNYLIACRTSRISLLLMMVSRSYSLGASLWLLAPIIYLSLLLVRLYQTLGKSTDLVTTYSMASSYGVRKEFVSLPCAVTRAGSCNV
jgi:hypothetical protein